MSKIMTPAMERMAKKQAKRKGRKSTPLGDVWRRLRRDKRAMIGLVIFVILVIIALFPSLFTSQSFSAQDYKSIHQMPSASPAWQPRLSSAAFWAQLLRFTATR